MADMQTEVLVRSYKSRILELCGSGDIEKAIETYAKAHQICPPGDSLYNLIQEAHAHLLGSVRDYIHKLLSPDYTLPIHKSRIVYLMEYCQMSASELNGQEQAKFARL